MFLLQHIDHYSRTKAIAEQMVIAANGGSLRGCEIDSCASSLNYMGKDTLRENCFLCLKKTKKQQKCVFERVRENRQRQQFPWRLGVQLDHTTVIVF